MNPHLSFERENRNITKQNKNAKVRNVKIPTTLKSKPTEKQPQKGPPLSKDLAWVFVQTSNSPLKARFTAQPVAASPLLLAG
jgi:hypothetical protein